MSYNIIELGHNRCLVLTQVRKVIVKQRTMDSEEEKFNCLKKNWI
jgi:hypothetical protein